MKLTLAILSITLSSLAFPLTSIAKETVDHKSDWGYQGDKGPESWGKLAAEYATCLTGLNQSPVNITDAIESDLPPLSLNYQQSANVIMNNGHTIQINYPSGSTLKVGDHEYELKQFHFHSPSENQINGKSFPLEAHLVHADKKGALAVLGIMFEEGGKNPLLEIAWTSMPTIAKTRKILPTPINVSNMLPSSKDYYRFNGSLTTPPCSEGVLWLVVKQTVMASKEQIEQFTQALQHANNRPLQAHNARAILQ
jgi:carbonic anhydrase